MKNTLNRNRYCNPKQALQFELCLFVNWYSIYQIESYVDKPLISSYITLH
jgi:hypothetical protein